MSDNPFIQELNRRMNRGPDFADLVTGADLKTLALLAMSFEMAVFNENFQSVLGTNKRKAYVNMNTRNG